MGVKPAADLDLLASLGSLRRKDETPIATAEPRQEKEQQEEQGLISSMEKPKIKPVTKTASIVPRLTGPSNMMSTQSRGNRYNSRSRAGSWLDPNSIRKQPIMELTGAHQFLTISATQIQAREDYPFGYPCAGFHGRETSAG